MAQSTLLFLQCPECGQQYDAARPQTVCENCTASPRGKSPLMARYDTTRAAQLLTPQILATRPRGLWRWAELLPVSDPAKRLTLGEGNTPLLEAPHLARTLGLARLYIKDESTNPTASFKARGLAVAVARAVELGITDFVIPTAGNAGGALAAYAARAQARAHVFMPKDAPLANQAEVQAFGAELVLVDGLISDAGRLAAEQAQRQHWFDVSTFKEPYRLEGKKTMGLELAEHFGWELPEVILYPTGGGTGLVGMWKAFAELEAMGWIGARRPRMVSVQAAGCAPIVRAFEQGRLEAEPWQGAATIASGLRVPSPFADRQILRVLRESQGTAIAVSDEEILQAQRELAAGEGIFTAPEGAATFAALKHLLETGWLRKDERVVLFNTGSGLKYL
ncbi:MAG: threonine synthase [Anaerolineae bacterium]